MPDAQVGYTPSRRRPHRGFLDIWWRSWWQTAYARALRGMSRLRSQIGSVMQPETRYAKSGDVHIAYQVVGNGPFDLVLTPGWVSHLQFGWEWPSFTHL